MWDDAVYFGGLEDELRAEVDSADHAAAAANGPGPLPSAPTGGGSSSSAATPSRRSNPLAIPGKPLRRGTSCHSHVIVPDGTKQVKHGLLTTSRTRQTVKPALYHAMDRVQEGTIGIFCEEKHGALRFGGDSIYHQHGGFQLQEPMEVTLFCSELRRHFESALGEEDAAEAARQATASEALADKRRAAQRKGAQKRQERKEREARKKENYKRAAAKRAAKRRKSLEAAGLGGGGGGLDNFPSPARTDGGLSAGMGSASVLGDLDMGSATAGSVMSDGSGAPAAGFQSVMFDHLGSGYTPSGAGTVQSNVDDWAQRSVLGAAAERLAEFDGDGSATPALHEQLEPPDEAAGSTSASQGTKTAKVDTAQIAVAVVFNGEKIVIYFTPRMLHTSVGYLLGSEGFKSKQRDTSPFLLNATTLDLSLLVASAPKPTLQGSIFRALASQFHAETCTFGAALIAAEEGGPLQPFQDRISSNLVDLYNERQRAKATERERARDEKIDLESVRPELWAAGAEGNAGIAFGRIVRACALLPCEMQREVPTGDVGDDGNATTTTLCPFGYCFRRFLEHDAAHEIAVESLVQSATDPFPGKRCDVSGRRGMTLFVGRTNSGKSSFSAYPVKDTLTLAGESAGCWDLLSANALSHLVAYVPPPQRPGSSSGSGENEEDKVETPLNATNLQKRRTLQRIHCQEEFSELPGRFSGKIKEVLSGGTASAQEARNLLSSATQSRSLTIHPRPSIGNTAESGGPKCATTSEHGQFQERFTICSIARAPVRATDLPVRFARHEVCPQCYWKTAIGLLTRKTGCASKTRIAVREMARSQLAMAAQEDGERDYQFELIERVLDNK